MNYAELTRCVVAALTLTVVSACSSTLPSSAQTTGEVLTLISPYQGSTRVAAVQCQGSDGYLHSEFGARTFLWQPQWLMAAKASRKAPAFAATFKALLAEADAALTQPAYSVMDKTHVPPSGDKHDYYSVAPYSWPNPNTPDGLPYVNRDGQVNPERYDQAFDTGALERMSRSVATLALAYYFTNDARYAQHAAVLLRRWFVDPETKMNPNLRYAQAVPGRRDGGPAGLIDSYRLVRVVEAIGLIERSGALTRQQQAALEAWFGAYADWLTSHPMAITERDSTNNHGMYYDVQLMSFALFARRDAVARDVAENFVQRRIALQVQPDGSMPSELKRTRSFHYTNYALAGAFDVATLAQCFNVDVWNTQADDGRSLHRAFDFLAAYAGREHEWPYPELHLDTEPLYDLLVRASWAFQSEHYATAARYYSRKYQSSLSAYLRVAPIDYGLLAPQLERR